MPSHIVERLARVVPPRAGNVRAVTASTSSASVEIDNDIFQVAIAATAQGGAQPGLPGNYGRALMRVHADGGDVWVLFGSTAPTVSATATGSGSTVGEHVPSGQDRDFEIDPAVDKFMAYICTTGSPIVRYRVVSFPNTNPYG